MRVLLRTRDPVRLSFLIALLKDAGIEALVLDAYSSGIEAGIQGFPQRLAVDADLYDQAHAVLVESEQDHSDG